jgi:hypothetical protein
LDLRLERAHAAALEEGIRIAASAAAVAADLEGGGGRRSNAGRQQGVADVQGRHGFLLQSLHGGQGSELCRNTEVLSYLRCWLFVGRGEEEPYPLLLFGAQKKNAVVFFRLWLLHFCLSLLWLSSTEEEEEEEEEEEQ